MPPGLELGGDGVNGLADGGDGLDGVVVKLHVELVLEGSHELQEVKGVGAEVLEAGLLGELGAIGDVQRVIDDLDDLLKNGVTVHGSSLDGARAPGELS